MLDNKRLKIAKRQKDALSDFTYQKQIPIEQAFQIQKSKNLSLKEKNQKLQIKCKLLYEKMYHENYKPQQIFDSINEDIYQLDKTIKQLQEQLYFRYSKQMSKLKKKVYNFLEMINFQIEEQDLEQLNDQISMILFLMEVFEIRYSELTEQNDQIQELIEKLREPEVISGTTERIRQLEQQVEFYMKENRELQILYSRLKSSQGNFKLQGNLQNIQGLSSKENVQSWIQKIDSLQSEKTILNLEIQKKNQKISALQFKIDSLKENNKFLQDQLKKSKKQEIKWKQKCFEMQKQKF